MDQVRTYNPPPNPAKQTDSRFAGYIASYGHQSWELDALDPGVLADLVRQAVLALRDEDAWDEAVAREDAEKAALLTYAQQWEADHT